MTNKQTRDSGIHNATGAASATPTEPDEIRTDIERTRADLGDTVEALAAKTDVKARAREAAKATTARVQAAVPEPVRQATERVRRRPLPVAVMAAAAAAAAACVVFLARRRIAAKRASNRWWRRRP